MKRIACVLGSPKSGGNTETIAKKLLAAAESAGAETQTFKLHDLSYKGCHACMACKTGSEECVIKDDLQQVLRCVREADVLVMTSPIYFGQITGQLKCFIDRTFSFLVPEFLTASNPSRLAPGKKCVCVLTQGQPDPTMYDVFPVYEGFLRLFGYETHVIRGVGMSGKADDPGMGDLLAKAEALGRAVAT